MAKSRKPPELTFQQHIADFLVRVHGYGVLEQTDITDTEHFIAEDQLWAFLKATQADQLQKLTDDYGTNLPANWRCPRHCGTSRPRSSTTRFATRRPRRGRSWQSTAGSENP